MISSDWRSQIFEEKKEKLTARLRAKWVKIGPKTSFFCHFLKFGLLVSLEIVYNDSLQHYLISSGGKIHSNIF